MYIANALLIYIILDALSMNKAIWFLILTSHLGGYFQVNLRLPIPQLHAEQIRALAGHERGCPDRLENKIQEF